MDYPTGPTTIHVSNVSISVFWDTFVLKRTNQKKQKIDMKYMIGDSCEMHSSRLLLRKPKIAKKNLIDSYILPNNSMSFQRQRINSNVIFQIK